MTEKEVCWLAYYPGRNNCSPEENIELQLTDGRWRLNYKFKSNWRKNKGKVLLLKIYKNMPNNYEKGMKNLCLRMVVFPIGQISVTTANKQL